MTYLKMDIKIAKSRLMILSQENDRTQYDNLPEEDYKAIFYSIHRYIPFQDRELNFAAAKFLYYGTLKFDKFNIPTPYAVNNDQFNIFNSFLNALRLQEGAKSTNAPTLELHRIKWYIYNIYNFSSLDESAYDKLNEFSMKVEQIPAPSNSIKLEEFEQQKGKLLSLISGLSSNSLYTRIRTRLPYKFANKTSIELTINNIYILVHITPHYIENRDSFFDTDLNSQIEILGATRWQNSFSEIEIKIDSLLDDSKSELPLTLLLDQESTFCVNNWNFLYKLTYEIIEKLWWFFKQKNIETSNWTPIPKDIPYIEFSQWDNEIQLEYKLSSNPSNIYSVKPRNNEGINTYKIEDLSEIEWTRKSYLYAKLYVEIGQYKEALFWLNVATESLIDNFIDSVVEDDIEQKEKLLNGVPTFESAEEILSKQFPEMAGRVKWPDSIKHPSIYNKIKNMIKLYSLPLSEKEVLKKYSIISNDRNALFHGTNTDIEPNRLNKAFNAYEWLVEKFSTL